MSSLHHLVDQVERLEEVCGSLRETARAAEERALLAEETVEHQSQQTQQRGAANNAAHGGGTPVSLRRRLARSFADSDSDDDDDDDDDEGELDRAARELSRARRSGLTLAHMPGITRMESEV